ncbi:MAG: hypothetical protein ACYTGH_06320 [Planctomycetota bacterium]|jgi:hypothetical protein
MDRREFLRGCGRVAMLGGLVGGAAALATRKPLPNQTCSEDLICTRCAQLSTCNVPTALTVKRAKR